MKRMLGWLLFGCVVSAACAEEGWVDLFNGKDLSGWVQRGGKAKYEVEDGVIVGSTVKGTPNSFLCTEKNYSNFELQFEVFVDPKLNSGVQIRSECFDKPTTMEWKGKQVKIDKNRVHGYQVEIDPSDRAWSAGIYDEGRRGWLFKLDNNENARKAFHNNEWNRYRVLCEGDRIRTWLNDVPAADLKDGMTPSGFIALQVHANGASGLQVKWRNLRIRELAAAPATSTTTADAAATTAPADAAQPRVLIYTRNFVTGGKGFVHDNIAKCVEALKALCAEKNIGADVSDDPTVFTAENLKKYKALVFANSNNEAFADDAQKAAFQAYIAAGGGFVGIHSASGSERKNDEFKSVLGGRFKFHTPNAPFRVIVSDTNHPATRHLGASYQWKDEGYICDLVPGLHPLLEMDLATAKLAKDKWPAGAQNGRFPLAWCQEVGGSRRFYTALGHDKGDYDMPAFRQHLIGGILWALRMAE